MKITNPQGKIVSIGELLVEFIPVDPALRIREEGTILKTASGSSGIFACAAAQLCDRAAFIGRVGRDSLSCFVYDTVRAQGVDVSHVSVVDEGQIGLGFVEYTGGGRNFQFYRKNSVGSGFGPDDIDEDYIKAASAIHYSGMLLEVSPEMRGACLKCVSIARENGVMVSFDPNIRKEVMSSDDARRRLAEAIGTADVIAPSLDEAQFVTGIQDPMELLEDLHARGPQVVALTRDKDGAIVSCGGEVATVTGIDLPALDPTGAGDTFAAMLAYGVQQGWNAEKLALYCNCAGTLAVTKHGSIGRALPTMAQVEELAAKGLCTVTVMKR